MTALDDELITNRADYTDETPAWTMPWDNEPAPANRAERRAAGDYSPAPRSHKGKIIAGSVLGVLVVGLAIANLVPAGAAAIIAAAAGGTTLAGGGAVAAHKIRKRRAAKAGDLTAAARRSGRANRKGFPSGGSSTGRSPLSRLMKSGAAGPSARAARGSSKGAARSAPKSSTAGRRASKGTGGGALSRIGAALRRGPGPALRAKGRQARQALAARRGGASTAGGKATPKGLRSLLAGSSARRGAPSARAAGGPTGWRAARRDFAAKARNMRNTNRLDRRKASLDRRTSRRQARMDRWALRRTALASVALAPFKAIGRIFRRRLSSLWQRVAAYRPRWWRIAEVDGADGIAELVSDWLTRWGKRLGTWVWDPAKKPGQEARKAGVKAAPTAKAAPAVPAGGAPAVTPPQRPALQAAPQVVFQAPAPAPARGARAYPAPTNHTPQPAARPAHKPAPRVAPPRPIPTGGNVNSSGNMHPAIEAIIEQLDNLATYEMPDEEAQEDIDLLLGSIPELFTSLGRAIRSVSDHFDDSPVHQVPIEFFRDIATSSDNMSESGSEVYQTWADYNADDIARSREGRINESNFNVSR